MLQKTDKIYSLADFFDKALTAKQFTFLASEGYELHDIKKMRSNEYNQIMAEIKKDTRSVSSQPVTQKQMNKLKTLPFNQEELSELNRSKARTIILGIMETLEDDEVFLQKLQVKKNNAPRKYNNAFKKIAKEV